MLGIVDGTHVAIKRPEDNEDGEDGQDGEAGEDGDEAGEGEDIGRERAYVCRKGYHRYWIAASSLFAY